MRSTVSRWLVATIVLAVVVTGVSASPGREAATTATSDGPITLSVFSVQNATIPPENNKIYKLIQEKLGVTFQWDIAVGDKDQKIGVMIASQDYPDLLHIDSNKFIEAGAVIPLEGLIDQYGPNLKRHYTADPTVWAKMIEKDGHIYCPPNWGVIEGGQTATYYAGPAMWIQKAVMKEAGYPKITTIDEYFNLISQYKARHPTTEDGKPTVGFSILTHEWHVFNLINPPQFLAGYPNDGNGIVNPATGKYAVHLGSEPAKRWFKLLSEMNAKGLVDRESFVDTYDQYLAKLSYGQVLGIHDQLWQFQDSQFSLISQGKILQTMMPLPIVFEKGVTPHWRDSPLPNLQRGFGISVKAKDPVRIMKFLNAQLSEEWQKIFSWGIEGEDYTLASDGQPVRTPEQRRQQDDPTWKLSNKADLWYGEAPKLEGRYTNGMATVLSDNATEYFSNLKPQDVEILKAYNVVSYAELVDKNPPLNPAWYPAWQISPPDGSPAQLAWAKADETYRRMLPRVVLGRPEDFDKNWQAYMEALGPANLKVYEDFVQQGISDRITRFGKK
jgi:putative aldouronate transport system substrate-binding protein